MLKYNYRERGWSSKALDLHLLKNQETILNFSDFLKMKNVKHWLKLFLLLFGGGGNDGLIYFVWFLILIYWNIIYAYVFLIQAKNTQISTCTNNGVISLTSVLI